MYSSANVEHKAFGTLSLLKPRPAEARGRHISRDLIARTDGCPNISLLFVLKRRFNFSQKQTPARLLNNGVSRTTQLGCQTPNRQRKNNAFPPPSLCPHRRLPQVPTTPSPAITNTNTLPDSKNLKLQIAFPPAMKSKFTHGTLPTDKKRGLT